MKRFLLQAVAFFGLTIAAHAQCATGYTQLSNVYACQPNSGPITATNLTHSASSTAVTSAGTASVAPNANQLVVVTVSSGVTSGTPNTPTVTGASGTWTQFATQLSNDGLTRLTLFRDLNASPGSGALTIDFAGQSQTKFVQFSVDQFSSVDTSGTHGSGAIVQTVGANPASAATTGLTINLAALGNASNIAMGAVRNSAAGSLILGSGFTELSYTGDTNGVTVEDEWAVNMTGVNWTWASQTVASTGIALEIKHQ